VDGHGELCCTVPFLYSGMFKISVTGPRRMGLECGRDLRRGLRAQNSANVIPKIHCQTKGAVAQPPSPEYATVYVLLPC